MAVRINDTINIIDLVLHKILDGDDFVFECGMGIVDARVNDGYGSPSTIYAIGMEPIQVPNG